MHRNPIAESAHNAGGLFLTKPNTVQAAANNNSKSRNFLFFGF
jgi:hypothetical protein